MPHRSHGSTLRRVAIALASTGLLMSLSGCYLLRPAPTTDARTGGAVDVGSVEIREYQGKNLGSIADFRENSIKGPQAVDLASYRLEISGEATAPKSLTFDEVIDRDVYKKVVTLNCVEGWSVAILWEGVRIVDLLEEAGYERGAPTVIFHCADGYTTSLPLDVVVDRNLLLAYKMNGIDLPKERGFPFQVVAEDRWGYKWAKWVTRIEVSDDADYEGYWESRGYENDATLPGEK